MAENKRTDAQIENDLVLISEMYLKGEFQETIKNAINARYKSDGFNITLTRQQIGYDIKKLISLWRESYLLNIDEVKQAELEKINKIENEMWRAWEKSKSKEEIETEKEGYNSKGGLYELKTVKRDLIGDTKYIDTIKWCIEMRLKLAGWNPEKEKDKAPDDPEGDEDDIDVEVEIPNNGRDPDSKYI